MKFFSFRHIMCDLVRLSAFFMALTLAGCSLVVEPGYDCDEPDGINVSFRIFAGVPVASRAVEEDGSTGENYIDPKDLKILLFDDDDETLKLVLYDNGEMDEATHFVQLAPGYYYISTKLPSDKFDKDSKFAIVALANWHSSDTKLTTDLKGHKIDATEIGTLTVNDLKAMTFTLNPSAEGVQPDSWMPGDDNDKDESMSWIPMFGSSHCSLEKYGPGVNSLNLPDVKLLRAVTKIQIFNNDKGGPIIKSIEFVNRNTIGLLVPKFEFKGFTENVSEPNIPEPPGFTSDTPLPFHRNGDSYTAYIPEMDFYDQGRRQAIRVTIDMSGDESVKWIYFTKYGSNGLPILDLDKLDASERADWKDIKRNYIYQYTINSLAFEFVIDVVPWVFGGKVHLDPDDIVEIPDPEESPENP